MEINNQYYDQHSDSWWHENSALSSLQAMNPGRFRYIDQVFSENQRQWENQSILDIGCGGGFICEAFARRGAIVSGIDPSEGTIKTAIEHSANSQLDINYQSASGENLPFDDHSFDYVSCFDVLEHVNDLEKVIAEVDRVLKPGGVFLYDTVNRTWFSWLLMIKIMQDWPTRVLEKNTHVWHMFIKPKELRVLLDKTNLTPMHETGFSPSSSPIKFLQSMIARYKGKPPAEWVALLELGPSPIKAAMYIGWALKTKV